MISKDKEPTIAAHVIVIHGIGFHEERSGIIGIAENMQRKGLTLASGSVELYWAKLSDLYTDRESNLGLLRSAAYALRLAVYEVWNSKFALSANSRKIMSEVAYIFLFSAFLISLSVLLFGLTNLIVGIPNIDWFVAGLAVMVAYAMSTLFVLLHLFPLTRMQFRNTLRYFALSIGVFAAAPLIVVFFGLRYLARPAFVLLLLPAGFLLLIYVLFIFFGAPTPQNIANENDQLVAQITYPPNFLLKLGLSSAALIAFMAIAEKIDKAFYLRKKLATAMAKSTHVISSIFKYVADVALYLCHSGFRQKIQQRLRDECNAAPKDKKLVLCAHSLGTVISIDTLRKLDINHEDILLITGGSPLERWLHRFIPNAYPPSRHIQESLEREGKVKWVNVYRTADPIGSVLGLKRESEFDLSGSKYRGRWSLPAHADYWSDTDMADAVVSSLTMNTATKKL